MNLSTKQKQTHRHREQIHGFQSVMGKRYVGELGLAEVNRMDI